MNLPPNDPNVQAIADAVRNRKPLTLAGVKYVPEKQEPDPLDTLLADIRKAKAKHLGEPTIWPSSIPTVLPLLERLVIEVRGSNDTLTARVKALEAHRHTTPRDQPDRYGNTGDISSPPCHLHTPEPEGENE